LTRIKKKRARRMKQVVEMVEMDPRTKELLTNEVFAWIPSNDSFSYSGKSYLFDKIAIRRSMSEEGVEEEWKMRKEVIEWMRKKGHRNYIDVANIVSDYYREPEEFIKRIRKDMKENVK
jgi:flagellar protein FlaI